MMIELNGVDIGYLTGHDKSGVLHQDINLELNLGEFVCMIGPNGAGKSTLIRTISGLQKPLKGNILLDNRNIYQTPPAFLARLISVALTAMVEISNASVYDMVAYGRSPYTNFFGKLSKHDHVIIEKSLESAGIAHLASRKFDTLSDGERQKVLIAKSLAQETPFIFLDEPTAFLDFPGKVEIMQLLREAAWIHGKSILLITHDINLAIQFADRLWLMARHKPIITGIPEDLVLTKKIGLFFDKEKIKFEDEKIIYSVLKSAVKAALGKFSITPAIDFDVEPLFDFPTRTKDASTKQPTVGFNPDYNPFEKRQAPLTPRQISNRDNWDKMIPPKDFSFGKETDSNTDSVPKLIEDDNSDMAIQLPESNFLQLHRKYIITQVKSGLMIIDQQRAHERIMYERYLELLSKRVTISQQVLFGVKISLSAGDSELLNEIMEDLNLLGFNIKADKNKPFQYIAEGIPAGTEIENVPDTIDRILHNYKQGLIEFAQSKRVNLARSMAKNLSVKTGKVLQQAEMKTITEELFSCQAPEVSLDGEPTVKVININKYFNHKE
jgi:iron complex transport system ATP-binding protein